MKKILFIIGFCLIGAIGWSQTNTPTFTPTVTPTPSDTPTKTPTPFTAFPATIRETATPGAQYEPLILRPQGGGDHYISVPVGSDRILIETGNAGVAANASADELVLEGTGANVGLSIITSNAHRSGVYFGDEDDSDVGKFEYNHSNNRYDVTVNADLGFSMVGSTSVVLIDSGWTLEADGAAQFDGNVTNNAEINGSLQCFYIGENTGSLDGGDESFLFTTAGYAMIENRFGMNFPDDHSFVKYSCNCNVTTSAGAPVVEFRAMNGTTTVYTDSFPVSGGDTTAAGEQARDTDTGTGTTTDGTGDVWTFSLANTAAGGNTAVYTKVQCVVCFYFD